ncbi:hypothetical protein GGI25_002353 [Coemansia spiralis]|uniref:Cyclin N-terminal domain-containing protein n=1 Tax=Coemansia spiralis TaxID=417178 RepID=A0A9W8G421_9FUNG|nr:hypothetical protein GGI26_003452 [Coemansia sp. RSA 1358]KAJ2678368.1 hypothetical protein GGI25_002353 [Coemansia spiralis]
MFSMRPTWLKKDNNNSSSSTEIATRAGSPDSPKFKELSSSVHGKPKALSRSRVRELLNLAMIKLMERMIAELFPCVNDGDPASGFGNSDTATPTPLPTFEEFLKHICRRTRTPLTCMCLALLYLTRLRANHPRSRGSPGSSYRLALSSLCVATKYLYDDAYHTCSWVQVSMGLFSQREVNQMEMEFMYFLHYQLGVTPTEWNQWIATLEAKLVSRWQEKGKADVIYGFGLFLSYECCEPSAQETVRDIAWGEGGKSLLSMLSNAIHLPGSADAGKGSPSADSAVSDSTCLPTPDPNSWFRIRSPAPVDTRSSVTSASAVAACSNSITPTTAQFAEIAGLGEDSSSACLQKNPNAYIHNNHCTTTNCEPSPSTQNYAPGSSGIAPVKQPGLSATPAHPLRPSSVCSMPGIVPSASGYSYDSSTYSTARYGPAPTTHAQNTYRHVSESKSHAWRTHSSAHSATLSPSRSQSASSREDAGIVCLPNHITISNSRRHFATGSTSIAPGYSGNNAPPYYTAGARSSSNVVQSVRSISSSTQYDKKQLQTTTTLPRLPFVNGSRQSSHRGIPSFSSSNTTTGTVACRDFRSNEQSGMDPANVGTIPAKDAQQKHSARLESSECTPTAASIHDEVSPRTGAHNFKNNSNRYMLNGAGISSASCATSVKSSVSSLKATNRKPSWRNSSKNTGSSFTQRLRSFAVFSWTSGGNAGNNDNSNSNGISGGSESIAENNIPFTKPRMNFRHEKDTNSHDIERGSNYRQSQLSSLSIAAATMRAVSAGGSLHGRQIESKRSSCCQSQMSSSSGIYSIGHHQHTLSNVDFSNRPNDMHDRRALAANVDHVLDSIASPSYDFEMEMAKYVSMKS